MYLTGLGPQGDLSEATSSLHIPLQLKCEVKCKDPQPCEDTDNSGPVPKKNAKCLCDKGLW